MSKLRWLRTKLLENQANPTAADGPSLNYMRALRSDGQPFMAWGKANDPATTPESLRAILDGMLDDPALSFVEHADEKMRKKYCSMFKGEKGWIEEPPETEQNHDG